MPRAIVAPALCLLLALAACGSDDSAAEATTAAPTATATRPTATATATTELRASSARGVKLLGIGRFDAPLYVTAPPGDRRRIFVVEQGGTIRVVRGGKRLSRPFLDLRSRVISGGEQGLLSLAFAPDYERTRRFYVNYTDRGGTQSVVEFRRSKRSRDRALTRGRLVLRYDDEEANHNGGL
ncbi:MAG TPA: PQQ-dependent sugar dehydrogenase, partial [Solirubrobacteraceae bacterium]|nr:PQQ-dependent sugar dehydrogenase [Solirubrobacteraceae bacterium]